jgi:Trk K+ transport system NAD-binding subunit
VLFISILFILLSAHLPLSTIEAVGWPGVWTVILLMWVVRPLNVLVSAWRTDLTWRERLFAMWISPRGVVAISISSFVGLLIQSRSTEPAGFSLGPADGEALMALVFLTIAITVVVQGLTAAPVSQLLGLAATSSRYAVIVGADSIGRVLASELRTRDWETLLVDANPRHVAEADRLGLAALHGNALDRSILESARTEDASVMVATTENQEVNFLACQLAREEYHVPAVYPALVVRDRGPRERLMDSIGGLPAFAEQVDVARWNHDIDAERARILTAIVDGTEVGELHGLPQDSGILPLLVVRGDSVRVAHSGLRFEKGQAVVALVRNGAEARFREVLRGETAATGALPS